MKSASVKKINSIGSIVTFSLVLIFGIVFLVFAVMGTRQEVPENFVETDATVSRIEEELSPTFDESDGLGPEDYEHRVFVEYKYNGETFSEKEYGNYNSSMKNGDTVIIYVNPNVPSEFMVDPSGMTVFVIIGIGIVLLGIGGVVFSIYKKKRGII